MSAATILFTDIVGFSRRSTAEQQDIVHQLNRELQYEIQLLLKPPAAPPRAVALPTGDGAAIAFLHDAAHPLDIRTVFCLCLRLHRWAYSIGVALRIGLHTGPISFVTDVNGHLNVCGDTINMAQRVMDAADGRQVLLSEAAFREHIGAVDRKFTGTPFASEAEAGFAGPFDVFAKHRIRIAVYKMTLSPAHEWWDNEDPAARNRVSVSVSEPFKPINEKVGTRLSDARRLAFVQLTGNRLLPKLRSGDVKLADALERLWVFMPEPEHYARLPHSPQHPAAGEVTTCVAEWKEFLGKLRAERKSADIRLGLFTEPAFLGASFTNWDRPEGRIHVSAYVWGIATPNCPAFDLEWISGEPSPLYDTYVTGLDYLHSTTVNALDQA